MLRDTTGQVMRDFGKWFAIEEEDVGVKASPARTALRVALNLLGEKNETGRPKAERAGANESRCRWAGAAKCEDAVLGSRWLDGQARERSGRAIGTSRINVGLLE